MSRLGLSHWSANDGIKLKMSPNTKAKITADNKWMENSFLLFEHKK